MAHGCFQNSSFVTKLLQHSHSHLSGNSEVSSCTLISLKPLKRRSSYKASFMQIWPVFWQLFSFSIPHLAEQSQSTCCPSLVVGRPTAVCACLHLPVYSQCSFSTVTQDSSSLPSDSHLHDFPFGCEQTPALCWLFRPHRAYHPVYSLSQYPGPVCGPSPLQKPVPLPLSTGVQIPNSLLAFASGATFLYKDFSPLLFQPVPVSPSLMKHFLPSTWFFTV